MRISRFPDNPFHKTHLQEPYDRPTARVLTIEIAKSSTSKIDATGTIRIIPSMAEKPLKNSL